jgi:type III pantothenate kinase
MMLLAVDAGNTNIVFAVFEGRHRRGTWRISTDGRRTADEYAVWLTYLMGLVQLRPADISYAILASVVPAATFNLVRLCRNHFGCEPLVVGAPDVDLGIMVKIDSPGEIGADRVVNAIAARSVYKPPLIVIDFGTATTFDTVDADGNYIGGVIAPGIYNSIEALHMAAAQLPMIDVARPDRVIGRNTVAAMQSGVFWGYVGLIDGLVSRIKAEYGGPMTVVGTGGLAVLFSEATNMIDETDTELTLRGLLEIFERNTKT